MKGCSGGTLELYNNYLCLKINPMYLALTFEVLKYLLPAIVLYFTAKLLVQAYLKNEELKRAAAQSPERDQITLPLKIQAYERLILFLERIAPVQMLNRLLKAGMSGQLLQITLLQMIREEFEHNVAQQIYISSSGWALIKKAKEEVILLINKTASEIGPDSSGHDLAKKIIENWGRLKDNPVQAAIDQLKSEVQKII